MMSISSDFHVHTAVSYDTENDCLPERIAENASALGLREIGLTDHVQVESAGAPGFDLDPDDEGPHRQLRERIRAERFSVRFLMSWEVDYFSGGRYSFDPTRHYADLDYVLLGHHFFACGKDASDEQTAEYLMDVYMDMAQESYADIIAHPFYVAPRERHGRVLARITDEAFTQFFEALRDRGKAAEITAFQFVPKYRDVAQSRRIYALARRTGVKFVLDSDAHRLSEIGDGQRCLPVLRKLGFTENDFVNYDALRRLREPFRPTVSGNG